MTNIYVHIPVESMMLIWILFCVLKLFFSGLNFIIFHLHLGLARVEEKSF